MRENENKYLQYLNKNYFREVGFITYEPHIKTQRARLPSQKGEYYGR